MGNTHTHVFISHKDGHKHSLLENDHNNVKEHISKCYPGHVVDQFPGKEHQKSEGSKQKNTFIRQFSLRKIRDKTAVQKSKTLRNSKTDTFYKHQRLSNGTHYDEEPSLEEKHVMFQAVKEKQPHAPSVSLESLAYEDDTKFPSVKNQNLSIVNPQPSQPTNDCNYNTKSESQTAKSATSGDEREDVHIPTEKKVSARNGHRFSHSSYGPDAYSDDDVFPDFERKNPPSDRRPIQLVGSMAQRGLLRMRKSFRSLRLRTPHAMSRKYQCDGNGNIISSSTTKPNHQLVEESPGLQTDPQYPEESSFYRSPLDHSDVVTSNKPKSLFLPRVRASFQRKRQRTHSSTADDVAMLD